MSHSGGVKNSHPLSTTKTGDIHKPCEPSCMAQKKKITKLNNLIHQVNLFYYFFSASLMFLKMSVQFSFQSLTFFNDIINQKHCFFNICFRQKCIKQKVSVREHWNDFCLRFVQILRAKYFDLSLTKYIFLVFGKV